MIVRLLLKSRGLSLLLGWSLLLAIIWLWWISPAHFNWMGYTNPPGDLAQHLSGWYAFAHDSWHFPLLKTQLFDYPKGANISLTDSIPLFALIFKPFRAFLPAQFNYFSLFFIFCYLSQAVAATTLALSMNQKNLLATSALTLFALSMPIISYRIGLEDSLSCQCFIVFALSVYLFNHRRPLSLFQIHWYFGLILGLSLLVHPYLTAMSYPFYLATVCEYKKRVPQQSVLKAVLIMHAAIILECIVLGLGGGMHGVVGFGILTMNLSAPVYGGVLFHDQPLLAYHEQYEGFAYLGWGLIILIVIALFLTHGRFKQLLGAYRPLLIASLALFIYAIYGSIYLGTIKIAQFGAPHFFLTYDFRANGRFFWPCSYVLLIFAVATMLQRAPRWACWLIPILLVLQFFDIAGYTHDAKVVLAKDMSAPAPQTQVISKLIQQSKIVIFYPEMACPALLGYDLLAQTQLLSAKAGIPINTTYTTHFESNTHCQDQSGQFKNLRPALLISPVSAPSPTILTLLKNTPTRCQVINQVYYCMEF